MSIYIHSGYHVKRHRASGPCRDSWSVTNRLTMYLFIYFPYTLIQLNKYIFPFGS